MDEPNEYGQRSDPHDANWGSMFLFGRWGWDGYLFGAEQGDGISEKSTARIRIFLSAAKI